MPSRDEILAAYEADSQATVALVEALQQQITAQATQVAQLQARLNQNSHNSHQPPASDGPAKRSHPRSLRKRSGKKSGGQSGHPGATRCLVDDPTTTVPHVPPVNPSCLPKSAPATKRPTPVL